MSHLKYLVAVCATALIASLGLGVAWPTYSLADIIDTFTFTTGPLFPFANLTPPGWSVSGSFSIPDSDLPTTLGLLADVPNSDITALSFVLTTPDGSVTFDLSDIVGSTTYQGTGTSPANIFDGTTLNFLLSPAGCNFNLGECGFGIQIGANTVPGSLAFLGVFDPGATTTVYGHWTAASSAAGVPGPIAGAGLPGLVFAGVGLLVWYRRKQTACGALSAA
jgi:hypothetical protein